MGAVVKIGNLATFTAQGSVASIINKALEYGEGRPELIDDKGVVWFADSKRMLPDGVYTLVLQDEKRDPVFGQISPAPSSHDLAVVKSKQMADDPDDLNFRPSTAAPRLPLPLLEPAFGMFQDVMRRATPIRPQREDYEHYKRLAVVTSDFHDDEDALREELRKAWDDYCTGDLVQDMMFVGGKDRPRADLGIRESKSQALLAVFEVKQGISGNKSESQYRAIAAYKRNWTTGRKEAKERFSDTCYPALLLEHVGNMLTVGALAAVDGHVWYQPLAYQVLMPPLGHDAVLCETGVMLCRAVKETIVWLREFYQEWGERVSVPVPKEAIRLPWPLRDLLADDSVAVTPLDEKRCFRHWLYKVESKRGDGSTTVVKFVQHYGTAVHRAWGDANLAPRLIKVRHLEGGWLMVIMEILAEEQGWKLLYGHPEREVLERTVLLHLSRAHKVQVGEFEGRVTYGVHGDMRDANVMVKIDESGEVAVRFIDFDWAKEENVPGSVYPAFMNHSRIDWPEGVSEGQPMLQEHDRQLLGRMQERMPPPPPVCTKKRKALSFH